jgi:hypothetical protein
MARWFYRPFSGNGALDRRFWVPLAAIPDKISRLGKKQGGRIFSKHMSGSQKKLINQQAARTTVPQTTIHKHGKALFKKNEIRLARQRLVPPPAFDSACTKDGCQF